MDYGEVQQHGEVTLLEGLEDRNGRYWTAVFDDEDDITITLYCNGIEIEVLYDYYLVEYDDDLEYLTEIVMDYLLDGYLHEDAYDIGNMFLT